jgi:hypothetical protein
MKSCIRSLPYRSSIVLTAISILFGIAMMPAHAEDEFSNAQAVQRVSVQYQDGNFEFLSSSSTRKVLPPSDQLPPGQDLISGFWYELQNASGEVKYRRIVDNPVLLVFEGPDIESPGSIVADRKEGIPATRVFPLLIPQSSAGDVLVLFGSPISLGAQAEPATELARLPLFPIIE